MLIGCRNYAPIDTAQGLDTVGNFQNGLEADDITPPVTPIADNGTNDSYQDSLLWIETPQQSGARKKPMLSRSPLSRQAQSQRKASSNHSALDSLTMHHPHQWAATQQFSTQLQVGSCSLPHIHDISPIRLGPGSGDGSYSASTWAQPETHAYPLQDIGVGSGSEPHWMDDYRDDFGATGTRVTAQLPCFDEAEEAAGRFLSTYPGERSQSLNPLFVQNTTANCSQFDNTGDSNVEQMPEIHSFDSQEILPLLSQEPVSTAYNQSPTPFIELEPPVHGQVYELDESSIDSFLYYNDATTQVGSLTAFPESRHDMNAFSTNLHHETNLNLLLENGRGDMTTESGVKMSALGRRGPLPADRASRIAKIRRDKSVCITCRLRKVSVSHSILLRNSMLIFTVQWKITMPEMRSDLQIHYVRTTLSESPLRGYYQRRELQLFFSETD